MMQSSFSGCIETDRFGKFPLDWCFEAFPVVPKTSVSGTSGWRAVRDSKEVHFEIPTFQSTSLAGGSLSDHERLFRAPTSILTRAH